MSIQQSVHPTSLAQTMKMRAFYTSDIIECISWSLSGIMPMFKACSYATCAPIGVLLRHLFSSPQKIGHNKFRTCNTSDVTE